jgi:two-component system, sensor histidine kinase and response regulator
MRTMAADRGIEITLHGLSALPTDVVGDPGRLRQVITRLVDNAVKYTTRDVCRSEPASWNTTQSSVTVGSPFGTPGSGSPRTRWRVIFEPFSQAG